MKCHPFIFASKNSLFHSTIHKNGLNLKALKTMMSLLHTLENQCLMFLSTQKVTTENLHSLIGEFLYTQPKHVMLILVKEVLKTDAVSFTLAHEKNNNPDFLIQRVTLHLNHLLYETIKTYYFQSKS
ncbi:histidine kinase [Legionella nautarum]|nr:histidine kinase [Legionella nautarum]